MDEKVVAAIHELANALAGLGNWQQQLVSLAILLVVAAGGSFFGAYLKTRATNAAMADDLEDIKRQLRETTATAETIKSQIGKRGELHSLRIRKLEEMMEEFLTVRASYQGQFSSLFEVGPPDAGHKPPQHVFMLAKFYFPEHEAALRNFAEKWRDCIYQAAVDRVHVMSAVDDLDERSKLMRWHFKADFPMEEEARVVSIEMEGQLVKAMHDLLAEGEPRNEAGRAPA